MLTGLNHLTLAVTDLDKSLDFYYALGFKGIVRWNRGAYLSLNSLWLCLALGEVDVRQDYSHISFDISDKDFLAFSKKLVQFGITQWKENTSEGNSMYILDPDGHKLEIHSGDLDTRLQELKSTPYKGLIWL